MEKIFILALLCAGSYGQNQILTAAFFLIFKGESGSEQTITVQKVDGPAVWQGAHNKESSIRSFAKACFQYAIDTKQDLWFSTKDTIAKVYDGAFKRIFEEEYKSSAEPARSYIWVRL